MIGRYFEFLANPNVTKVRVVFTPETEVLRDRGGYVAMSGKTCSTKFWVSKFR